MGVVTLFLIFLCPHKSLHYVLKKILKMLEQWVELNICPRDGGTIFRFGWALLHSGPENLKKGPCK